MSAIQIPKLFTLFSWIAIVATTVVDLVPLNRHGQAFAKRNELPVTVMEALSTRHLGNSDITKLLDDLDNQTEAIKSGQEIGEELLGGKKHMTRIKDSKLEITNSNFFGKEYSNDESKGEEVPEEVTDNSSQSIAEAPALVDKNGVPEKTTALESGASYLAGKPLLILNKESKDLDVSKWFLYYPLSTESDQQIA